MLILRPRRVTRQHFQFDFSFFFFLFSEKPFLFNPLLSRDGFPGHDAAHSRCRTTRIKPYGFSGGRSVGRSDKSPRKSPRRRPSIPAVWMSACRTLKPPENREKPSCRRDRIYTSPPPCPLPSPRRELAQAKPIV